MRARPVLFVLVAVAGCSLVVDTGDLSDGPRSGTSDASTENDGRDVPDDATAPTRDPGAIEDAGTDALTRPRILGDWPFDEGSGTSLNDVSGRGHHGLIFGAGGAWVTDRTDQAGSAYQLATDDDYVKVPGSPDFDRPSNAAFSMMAWARASEAPDHDMFFSISYGDSDESFGLELMGPTKLTYFDGEEHVPEATVPDVVGAWHHYAVVVTGTEVRLFFDGVRVGQGSPDRTPRSARELLFGRSTWGDRFRGALDKARLFGIALADAEVFAEMNR